MSLQGTTQAIGAGLTTATVTGAFPATYQVAISTSWVTAVLVSAKTATGFTVTFATPVPAAGGTFDWTAGTAISPSSSGTAAVGAGLSTVTIAGTFSAAYQVALSTGWSTDYDVVSQGVASFVINFSNPAPAGGSTVDWITNVTQQGAVVTPLASASVALAAGATQLVVTSFGTLPASYEVTVAPGWVTGWDVVSKTTTGFTINFAVPVPPSGATVFWIIFGSSLGVVSLSDYLSELRDLLHDPNDRFWSAAQKARYINRAMMRRDLDTAINRQTFSFTLTAGTDTYTFAQVNGRIFDVISIVLIFGQVRCVLDNPSLTKLTSQGYRYANNYQGWTAGFARQGPSTVVFGPAPSIAFQTEWDCAVYALPLINLTDTDPVPYPYTQPVPYYAAYLAKTNEKRSGERDDFMQMYLELVGTAVNGRAGMIPNAYGGLR